MSNIKIVGAKLRMGKRLANAVRGLKEASSAICVIKHQDGSTTHGIGILYPDFEHLYFTPYHTDDPIKLLQAKWAATKISCLCDGMLGLIVALIDGHKKPTDRSMIEAEECFMYAYDAQRIYEEAQELQFDKNKVSDLVRESALLGIRLNDPFVVSEEEILLPLAA